MRVRHALAGIGTAICYASSPVFVRFGLRTGGTPLLAVTVGLLVATAFYVVFALLLRVADREHTTVPAATTAGAASESALVVPPPENDRKASLSRGGAYLFQIGAAVAIGTGTWFRYIALDIVPLAYIATLIRVNILVVLLLTPFLLPARKHRVTLRTVLGAAMIIGGTLLVSLG